MEVRVVVSRVSCWPFQRIARLDHFFKVVERIPWHSADLFGCPLRSFLLSASTVQRMMELDLAQEVIQVSPAAAPRWMFAGLESRVVWWACYFLPMFGITSSLLLYLSKVGLLNAEHTMTARIDLRLKWMDNCAPAPHNEVTWLTLQCVFVEFEVHHLEGGFKSSSKEKGTILVGWTAQF